LLGAAFLPAPLGFLAWFGLVPLFSVLAARIGAGQPLRRLFAVGYLYGLVFYGIGIHWVLLLYPGAMNYPWMRFPAWVAAAAYLAAFAGLSAALAGWLVRRARFPLAAALVVAFLAIELLRGAGELGFPWFQLGYSQHHMLPIVQLASLGSVSLVTAWVLALNALVHEAARVKSWRSPAALGAALLLLLPWAWGSAALRGARPAVGPGVALIQGNISAEMKWAPGRQPEILDRFLRLSAQSILEEPRPTLVVWPETATGSYLMLLPLQRSALEEFARENRVGVFAGYPDEDYTPVDVRLSYNAAGMVDSGGTLWGRYAKRHLVPFGERLPFQAIFPGLGRLDLGQAEWTPGRESVLFPSAAGPFSCLICFEAIFPDLARDDVRRGARWLVNITNDAWFGNSAALYQHAAMAVFRAVENRVTLARCANTGLTFVADPWGRRHSVLPVFETGVAVAAVSPPGPRTWFTRLGDWPQMLTWLALAWGAWRARPRTTRAAR
jgi:apolipoprotein N-acyltransferase